MSFLTSSIPYFKAWVRREYTKNLEEYHREFLHCMVVAVTTMPNRTLSFQVIFTGFESDDDESTPNVHGGAMWARMPITALIADEILEEIPERMDTHLAQPWDCSSRTHTVVKLDLLTASPWMCKIDNEFYKGKYMFTVDFTDSDISDCPAQHKQNHVIQLIDAGKWTGNIVALPNNRVRATSPALWVTGEGAPDFAPSQYIHSAEIHDSYTDPDITFNNL